MTDGEKKMKQYVNAVERRLNLPKDVKARVMSDFSSSIQARREAGMTDEQIYAELGDAKKAAEDLNGQMKEFSYRKSPWRYLFAALAVYGGARALGGLWALICYWILRAQLSFSSGEAAAIGIIGGADGPTAIFVTAPLWAHYLVPLALMIVGILGFLRLRKCKK